MILRNLSIAGMTGPKDILVENEKIAAVCDTGSTATSGISISLPGAIVFPGLINSHDHLDFNLFPQLGNGKYDNYSAWGRDIHEQNAAEIGAVLKIPQSLRTKWGIYKNLLNGVTTVIDHGKKLSIDAKDLLIGIIQDACSLHSTAFEKNWEWKINLVSRRGMPIVIHVGEGTDDAAAREIDRLIKWNLFSRPLVGIHGVAMNERQADGFKALVWCPASNYFLLTGTARIDRLKNHLPILFGTDSTLTAGWNIWDQIRLARKEGHLTDKELFDSLTINPAKIWGLPLTGALIPGHYADLVIAKPGNSDTPKIADLQDPDAFYSLDPEDLLLVMHHGRIRLFDATLYGSMASAGMETGNYKAVAVNNKHKYVQGDLPGLIKEIREYYPAAPIPVTID